MDLDKIKREADEQASQKSEEQQIREEIHTELMILYKMMETFHVALQEKMQLFMEVFLNDAITYFIENEFTIQRLNPTDSVTLGTELIANYNGLEISFKGINYEGEPIKICVGSEQCYFQFALTKDTPNYYGWLSNLDIGGTKLEPLGEDPEEVYRHFVNDDTCLDELYVVQKEIDQDQGLLARGVRELEKAILVVCIQDKTQTFSDFKAFWEAL